MPRFEDTIAALATPVGTAAIAVVRVSGPQAATLAADVFGKDVPARTVQRADYRDRTGTVVDDVLFTVFRGPHSYTGEDALEVSCHGNPFIAQQILEDLLARGCRAAEPGEFTQRAFIGGRMDLSQAEAVMDLIHARSERALAAANQQLRGALGRRLAELVEGLLAVIARVEAYIDFPEEDLPAEDRAWLDHELIRLAHETSRLLATSHYGEMLRDGIKTVILGAPNVGKSSLLNRLVGRERALVSPEPGTTRDFIEERIVVGPHCIRIIDTAGLNPSPAPLEQLGMDKTLEQVGQADLVLVVIDASLPEARWPAEIPDLSGRNDVVIILNKSDLSSNNFTLPQPYQHLPVVRISALTGQGIDALESAIVTLADSFRQEVGDDAIAISARHATALTAAQTYLASARSKVMKSDPVELLAADLREVLAAYGEITGRVDNERMLDHLFATFCIGK